MDELTRERYGTVPPAPRPTYDQLLEQAKAVEAAVDRENEHRESNYGRRAHRRIA